MHRMTMKLWSVFTILSILTLTIVSCSINDYKREKSGKIIQLAVAADFTETARRLGDDFRDRTGITVVVTSASSGALVNRIRSGAAFDAFLSANTDFPKQLINENLAVQEYVVYAIGKLALYSPDRDLSIKGADLLASGTFPRLALANPEKAPYGRAAIETLKKLGLLDKLKKNLVYGENVGKTLTLVETGKADAGFVAFSDIDTNKKGAWVVPEKMHRPIEQAAVVLSTFHDRDSVDSWMEYLVSEPARHIIQDAGYRLP